MRCDGAATTRGAYHFRLLLGILVKAAEGVLEARSELPQGFGGGLPRHDCKWWPWRSVGVAQGAWRVGRAKRQRGGKARGPRLSRELVQGQPGETQVSHGPACDAKDGGSSFAPRGVAWSDVDGGATLQGVRGGRSPQAQSTGRAARSANDEFRVFRPMCEGRSISRGRRVSGSGVECGQGWREPNLCALEWPVSGHWDSGPWRGVARLDLPAKIGGGVR